MKNNLWLVGTLLLGQQLLSVSNVQAGVISGQHSYGTGKQVDLQGLEWLPLTHSANFSRQQIQNGFTDHFGNVWTAGSWRYATMKETETLLGSLWGGTRDGYSHDNAAGAQWFLQNFGGIGYDSGFGPNRVDGKNPYNSPTNFDFSLFLFGLPGECSSDLRLSCLGDVRYFENTTGWWDSYEVASKKINLAITPNSGAAGYLGRRHGLKSGRDIYLDTTPVSRTAIEMGSLLVRTSPVATVNTPATGSLLLAAALLLWGRRAVVGRRRMT